MAVLFLPVLIAVVYFWLQMSIGIAYIRIKQWQVDLLLVAQFITMVLTNGLRSVDVGIDTANYRYHYLVRFGPKPFEGFFVASDNEPLYRLLCNWAYRQSLSFNGYLLIVALFSFGCVFLFIKRYAVNPMLGLLIYVFFDYYILSFTMLRQTVAMSVCLLYFVIRRNDKRDIWRFVACFIIAIGFHTTAVVFIPVYFVSRLKYSARCCCIMLGIGIVSFVFKGAMENMMFQTAERLLGNHFGDGFRYSSGGYCGLKLYILLWVVIWVALLLCDKKTKEMNAAWIYLTIMAIIIFPLVMSGGAVMRVVFYYMIFVIILIPNIMQGIHPKSCRIVGEAIVLLTGFTYYAHQVLSGFSNIRPYSFYFQ